MELTNNNRCFVCGKDNPYGLKLDFKVDNDKIKSEFALDEKFQGFKGIIHGGIIATLLDEAMVNLAYRLGINAVSANLNINLRKPAKPKEKLFLTGEIIKTDGKKIIARAELKDANSDLIANGEGLLIKIK